MSVDDIKRIVDSAVPITRRVIGVPRPDNALRRIDMQALALREPRPPEFLIPGYLPANEIALLSAHGGTGKSQVMLHLLVCVALGKPWHGIPTLQRLVAYVSYEDSEDVLHWRLARICEAEGISIHDLRGHLELYDGTTAAGAWFARREFGEVGMTSEFLEAQRLLAGAQVIVVDGSADVYGGNENDRAQVKAFLRSLRTLIPPGGALILIAHVDKASAQIGAKSLGFSGSTGWNNGVRSRWFMFAETEDGDDGQASETGNLRLEVRKSNLGPSGASMTLRYDEQHGVFVRIDAPVPAARQSSVLHDAEDCVAVKAIIRAAEAANTPIPAATNGTRTAHAVMCAHPDFPKALRGNRGRRRFYKLLEVMRHAGEVQAVPQRSASRNTREVLHVAD